MSVSYMTHPLIRHKITLLRKEDTSTNEFRKLVEEIAMLMGYEARNSGYHGKNSD